MSSNIQVTQTTATGRTRRCSICGDTTHDRRFHTIAERVRQVNIINANRENRRLSQERPRTRTRTRPTTTIPIPIINLMENIEYYISNNNIATINNIHQSNKMKDFKNILERIAREEKYISHFINKTRLLEYEYKECLIQYAIQMGAPRNLHFKDYFWRIVSLVYWMFNRYHITCIDDIIIGERFMIQPSQWYIDGCNEIAKEQFEHNQIRLKQKRLEKIILHREETNCDYFNDIECPVCYENIPKLNTIETCCNHNFCRNCFTKFVMNTNLNKSLNCPMCRTDIDRVYDIAIVYYSI